MNVDTCVVSVSRIISHGRGERRGYIILNNTSLVNKQIHQKLDSEWVTLVVQIY
jgi:hypothetical protein